MARKYTLLASFAFGVGALLEHSVAQAQTQIHMFRGTITAPDYSSGASAGTMSNEFSTPESDGRPGAEAYREGMLAFNRHDYAHAVHMLKVAASWGYKPAEYNLGVMFFQGEGAQGDRPLGAAWLILAAERGDPRYTAARDVVITWLSATEFARTDELWGQLQKTYGDEVALPRAKAQWAWARSHMTGSRVGGAAGELRVGIASPQGAFKTATVSSQGQVDTFASSSWLNVLTGGSTDGAIAYRQFLQSDDPYDPVFLKNRSGNVTVQPLQPVKAPSSRLRQEPSAAPSSSHPPRRS